MTDPHNIDDPEVSPPSIQDDQLRHLLRHALEPSKPAPPLLPGVQTKLRRRSRGKYYRDGWSQSKAPIAVFFVTSLLMLAVLILAYFALTPWMIGR